MYALSAIRMLLTLPQRSYSIFSPSVLDENGRLWISMYALMESEKSEDALRWVLRQMVTFCPEVTSVLCTVFSDKGLSEATVTDVFGPHVKSLLCVFHMGLNLAFKLRSLGVYAEVRFLSPFHRMTITVPTCLCATMLWL